MTELRDVLAAAQQAGKEKQAAQGTLKERAAAGLRAKVEAARQSAAEAWKNAKPVPERVYQTVDALVQGAATPEVRQAMGTYVQERNDAAREALQTRYNEIRTNVTNGVDRVVTGAQTRLTEVRTGVDTRVVQPTLAAAGATRDRVVQAGRDGQLFVRNTEARIQRGVEGTLDSGRVALMQGREAVTNTVAAGRQAFETGIDTARGAATIARQGVEYAVDQGRQRAGEAVAAGRAAAEAGVQRAQQTVDAGRQAVGAGIEAGRRTVAETRAAAEARARDWGNRTGDFFRRGGEAIQGEIQLRRAQVDAARHDMVAGVAETRANVVGGIYERGFGFLQKINSSMEGAKASAENHKRMAAEGRANVAGVKGLGLRLPPRGK